jgi:hypothetical protein
MQTQYGLGRNMELLEEGQIVAYQKVCMFAYGWVYSLRSCTMSTKLRPAPVFYGKHRSYSQAEYANKLLYIATLSLAKLSIISLLMLLTASNSHRQFGWALTAFIALWGIITEFIAAFQCGTQKPWEFLGEDAHCLSVVCHCRSRGSRNHRLTVSRQASGAPSAPSTSLPICA